MYIFTNEAQANSENVLLEKLIAMRHRLEIVSCCLLSRLNSPPERSGSESVHDLPLPLTAVHDDFFINQIPGQSRTLASKFVLSGLHSMPETGHLIPHREQPFPDSSPQGSIGKFPGRTQVVFLTH
mmetsp:Transcript_7651/g.24080  ORF Transcript_7651/g.24080 Transcript_7651/m.24080 type:complete len:126 (+) Transcript_7651:2178-2555(+)